MAKGLSTAVTVRHHLGSRKVFTLPGLGARTPGRQERPEDEHPDEDARTSEAPGREARLEIQQLLLSMAI